MQQESVQVIDLFCGCGGLSVGFEATKNLNGDGNFEVVLGMDNWRPAIDVFNDNHTKKANGAKVGLGRLADMNWFNHESEVLLYYLAHRWLSGQDESLGGDLAACGFISFIKGLSEIDNWAQLALTELAQSDAYCLGFDKIDKPTFTLATVHSLLGKLGLTSFNKLRIDTSSVSWSEEIGLLSSASVPRMQPNANLVEYYSGVCMADFKNLCDQVEESGNGEGRGQHTLNPHRMAALHAFLVSSSGKKLGEIWCEWQANRRAIQESYCLGAFAKLEALYNDGRRIGGILGGPPCKGFSRIGRAVIRELRKQGAHAWASNEFGDERNALMYKYVLFVQALKPKFFVFENVAHFASALKTPDGELDAAALLAELIEDVSDGASTYGVVQRILRAKEHGLPQARERFVLVGFSSTMTLPINASGVLALEVREPVPLLQALLGLGRPGEFEFGSSTISDGPSHRTKAYTLIDPNEPTSWTLYKSFVRMNSSNGQKVIDVDAHIFRRPRKDDQAFIEYLGPGIRWMDLKISKIAAQKALQGSGLKSAKVSDCDEALLLRCLLERISEQQDSHHHLLGSNYLSNGIDKHGDWLERLDAMRPCKTVVAHIGKDTYGYVHPYENRPISIREAARVQSFPDWFCFGSAGIVDAYSMIGNAVPPILAYQIAEKISAVLKGAKHNPNPQASKAQRQPKAVQKSIFSEGMVNDSA